MTARVAATLAIGVVAALAPAADTAAGARPRARLGTLSIARLHLVTPFYEGVSGGVLAHGPGHYPETRLPGQRGTIAIAGHRVTHTHPFLRLNYLRRNDRIVLRTRRRTFVYVVQTMRILRPQAVWALRSGRFERLVLTACHPPRSARYRLVVFARRI